MKNEELITQLLTRLKNGGPDVNLSGEDTRLLQGKKVAQKQRIYAISRLLTDAAIDEARTHSITSHKPSKEAACASL